MRQGTINLTALDRLIAIMGQFCFNAMPVSTKQVSDATLFICSLLVNTQANKGVKQGLSVQQRRKQQSVLAHYSGKDSH